MYEKLTVHFVFKQYVVEFLTPAGIYPVESP